MQTFIPVLLSALFFATVTFAAPKQPMNVLMIAIDDLNDWVGFLGGHPQTKTPNMDRLAAQSMIFENAQCSASACNPSRSALMSGIAPYESGLYSNGQEMRENPVLKDAVMLPRYFSDHGYTSMVRGKIFHHADMDPQSWDIMSNQQKDKIPVPRSERTDMTPYKHLKIKNGLKYVQKPQIAWEATHQPKELTKDYQNALWTAQWLTDTAKQETPVPFFLACGIFQPHLVWRIPAEHFTRIDKESIVLPPVNPNDFDDIQRGGPSTEYQDAVERGLREEVVWAYLSSIAYADDCVGVILDALENSPYRDNTIVVLWSDHGWHLGEKLRYKKSTGWEEVASMPFLISVPGEEPGRTTRPVSLIDLYPTLVDLAGLPEKPGLTGKSVAPLIRNPKAKWKTPAITTPSEGFYSLRSERWRYIHKARGGNELYDHRTDPNEWNNLIDNPEYARIVDEFLSHVPENPVKRQGN